jgi:uncharacterized protein YndB with AHSA1/START domain
VTEPATEAAAIRKSVTVNAPAEKAFRVFTEEVGSWWLFEGHSVFDVDAETTAIEPVEGGRWLERSRDGREIVWGTILAWEPPHRLVTSWHPGRDAETAQELEIRFVPEGDRTRVELEHRGWEKRPDDLPAVIRRYEAGWERILGERYAAAVGSRA